MNVVRMGNAGNGVPVFVIAGQARGLDRPFGATFDTRRACWMYPAYHPSARKVLDDFALIGKTLHLEFSDAAQAYVHQLKEMEQRYEAQVLPDGFEYVTKPYAHQVLGLCHLFYYLRSALFYAPGLGKSKVAVDLVRLLHYQGQKQTVVVMGPVVTVRNWGKEIDRHSGGTLRWGAVIGTPKQKKKVIERAAQGEFDILLVTYDTARNFVDPIVESVPYATVIADESQLIKEWRSARTKAAHEVGQKAIRKVLMTGTPTLGSPLDLYGQFKFLGDYFMPESYQSYCNKFVRTPGPNSHVVLGYKNLHILNARTLFVALRKSKEECLDLPEQTFVDVEYEVSGHQAAIYNQFVQDLKLDLELLLAQLGGTAVDRMPPAAQLPHAAALLNKLLQISSGFLIKNNNDPKLCDNAEPGGCRFMAECIANRIRPYTSACKVAPESLPDTVTRFDVNPKLDALVETLGSVLADPPNKMIIWCYYQEALNIVGEKLEELGYEYVRVDGRTGTRIQALADRFNEDPAVRVYLAQVSTGVGITLNAAAYMSYFELTYQLGPILQSLDRNYRIGQTKNVTVYRFLGRQTVEPAIMRLLDNKIDVDEVLTHKLSCIVCTENERCTAKKIKLFGEGCIYPRNMERPVARPHLIQIGERT